MSRASSITREHPAIVEAPALTFRIVWRLLCLTLFTLLAFVVAFLLGVFFFNAKWQQPFVSWWLGRFGWLLGLRVRVEGQPHEGGALWISNHVSWLDIFVLGGLRRIYFLSKAEVADWPVMGALARLGGTLYIERGAGEAGKISQQMLSLVQQQKRVLFFPEGTTTDGYQLKRFFSKLFVVATTSQCSIQPVLLCYREQGKLHPLAPFIGDDSMGAHFLQMLNRPRTEVVVKFLPTEVAGERSSRELAQHFQSVMGEQLQQLHGATQPPSRLGCPGVKV